MKINNNLLILLGTFLTNPILAQERMLLPDLVVSSKGQGEDYFETPARIDTISSSTVETTKPRYIGEVLSLIPGVQVKEVNPAVPSIGLRTPAKFSTPYFLSTLDGIPIASPMVYNHKSPTFLPIQNSGGNVEVLKGAESVLYGSNAMSGVINVLTPKVEEAEQKGNTAGIEIGERNFKKIKLSSGKKLDDKNSYYVSSSYTVDSGWRDLQDGNFFELVGKHYYKLDSGETLSTTFLSSIVKSNVNGYLSKAKYDNSPQESGLNISEPFSNSSLFFISSKLNKNLNNNLILVFEPYFRNDNSDLIAVWNAQTTPNNKTNVFTAGVKTYVTKQTEKSDITIGIDTEYSKLSYLEEQSRNTVVGPVWSPGELPKGTHYNYDVNYFNVSPFVKSSIFFNDNLRAEVGVRADYSIYDYKNKTSDGDCDSTVNTGGKCGIYMRVADRKDSFSNVGPKVGMNYKLTNMSSVYWNVGQNFKIPNASVLYNLTTSDASPDLKPEVSLSTEVGYKFEGQNFGVSTSIYQMNISDRIVKTQGSLNEMSRSINAGKSQHRGIEIGSAVTPVSDIRFDVSAAFVQNKFVDYKTAGKDYSGKTESNSPDTIYNIRTTYKPRFLSALTTSIDWKGIGSYWVEDANINKQDGHSLFNFNADYQLNKSTKINFKAVNFTNTKYAADVVNYGALNYRPGMPRTVYLGVEFKF